MNSKRVLGVIIVSLFLILVIGFVMAKNNQNNGPHNNPNESNETENQTKEMNYGRCVSNITKVKNSCFKEAQQKYKLCEKIIRDTNKNNTANNITINKTETKLMREACRNTLKQEKEVCKTNFKTGKDLCIEFKCKENEVFLNNTCVITSP